MRRERRTANFMFLEFGFVAAGNKRYDDAPFLYHAVGSGKRIAANWIQDEIDIVYDLFEFLFRVIDRNVGSELLQQVLIGGRGGGDHTGTARLCNLNSKTSDTSRATVNQHRLSALDFSYVYQCLPRC